MPDHIDALLNDPDVKPLTETNWLRPHQIEGRRLEVDQMARALNDPVAVKAMTNPGLLKRQNDERRRILEAQIPPAVAPGVMDKVAKAINALEGDVSEGMLSAEEERHAPADPNGQRINEYKRRWEAAKKPRILALKRLLLVRDRGTDNASVADIRYLQPRRGQTRNLYPDGTIPGVFALSPQAKANFDAINWDSPEVKAEIEKRIAAGEIRVNLNAKASDIGPEARGRRRSTVMLECDHAKCPDRGHVFGGKNPKVAKSNHYRRLDKQAGGIVEARAG